MQRGCQSFECGLKLRGFGIGAAPQKNVVQFIDLNLKNGGLVTGHSES